jgi:hypothetical protein
MVMAGRLLDSVLAIPSTALAMNFYLPDSDSEGEFRTSAAERRDRLLTHLSRVWGGDLVIVGEAPGWKGARQSGVPFTSARTVGLEGSSEGSATIVHGMLSASGLPTARFYGMRSPFTRMGRDCPGPTEHRPARS